MGSNCSTVCRCRWTLFQHACKYLIWPQNMSCSFRGLSRGWVVATGRLSPCKVETIHYSSRSIYPNCVVSLRTWAETQWTVKIDDRLTSRFRLKPPSLDKLKLSLDWIWMSCKMFLPYREKEIQPNLWITLPYATILDGMVYMLTGRDLSM